MSSPRILEQLRQEATCLEQAVLDACASGTAEQENSPIHARLAAFESCIDAAHHQGHLDQDTELYLHATVSRIVIILSRSLQHESKAKEVQSRLRSNLQQMLNSSWPADANNPKSTGLPFAWVQPLLQFVSSHICSPYPCPEQKQELLEQCLAAGWASVTQRKLEDWMNMARGKMGYTFIFKSDAINEDRNLMADYVCRVLSGVSADREGIPAPIIRRIEMMRQWVHDQYESRAARDRTSSWARDVVDLVQRLSVTDIDDLDAFSDGDKDEDVYSEDEFDSSDSNTLYSDTDVEDNIYDLSTSVIGAKRDYNRLGLGQPPSRMVSRTYSSSSLSSHGTLADLSTREASASSRVITEWDDGCDSDRPAKRRRSSEDKSSEERTSPTPTVVADSPPAKPKPFEHSYRSRKRKHSSSEDSYTSSPLNSVRHFEANPCAQVASTNLDALDSICLLNWDASSSVAGLHDGVDLSTCRNDTPFLDVEPSPDNLLEAVAACCEPLSSFHMDASFAWSKLQVYMLERMLRHGVHIVPPQESTPAECTPSITFDALLFRPEEFAYLCSLSMEGPGVGQAFVGPPGQRLGPDAQGMIGLLQPADTSIPAPSDGSMLLSEDVDFDEWYASLLNEPFVA